MARKRKKQNNLKNIIVFFIILLVLLVLALVALTTLGTKENEADEQNNNVNIVLNTEEVEKSENEEELNKLKGMTERNRIEYYVSKFIKEAENKNYEDAYALLNNDFKEEYFPTQKSFKEYAEKKFTKMLDVEYTNFERNGKIYVVWVILTDAINGGRDAGVEINFVVKENDFNDYELSFSAE